MTKINYAEMKAKKGKKTKNKQMYSLLISTYS